jgi:pimeloyl-ACP methyl ester carboxylesterase
MAMYVEDLRGVLDFLGFEKPVLIGLSHGRRQGHTDNPKRDENYTMAATVRHAHQFLQTLELKNVHVICHSRGGYVVGRLTLEHPEMAASVNDWP